ncbi:hypothetical protein NIES22_46010 [Calothrix brevissima NIES-22]|nr:hypothetical protein NIES22_46010 [Calothrix brevissima NIES-22]
MSTNIIFAHSLQIDATIQHELVDILNVVQNNAYGYLSKFRDDAGYTQKLKTAFGNKFNRKVANHLFDGFAEGNFSAFPTVEIVNRNDINGANGAFSITTGKIYLAAEFISQNANNRQAITNVLLEEIGHSIDAKINKKDAAGDEGDIFSRLVQDKSISQQELVVLRAEDDTATVKLDGQVIQIEQAVKSTSQFITLPKPTTTSTTTTTITDYGSDVEDIIQLQSYRTTSPGLIQKVWGYSGADIFNVNFELPGDGKVGIDFNAGNLKALAKMLVEPDWGVREKRLAMDMSMASTSTAIDVAASVASSLASSIPFAGGGISAGIEAAGIAAKLTVELGNIGGNYALDMEEYNNSLAGINNFFADQNNSDWGTVNVLDARTVVEIRDFEPGVDIITLPNLPTNWTWQTNSGTFGDTGKNYVSVSFKNGRNDSGEILRIGFNDYLSSLITGSQEQLILDLLTLSNSGWAIGDTIKQQKNEQYSIFNGTIANDVVSILATNTTPIVTLFGGLGDDVLIGRIDQNDELYGGDGNDYIAPGTGSDTINGGAGYDRVDYSNLTTGVNVISSKFTSIEGVVGTIYNDTIDLSSLIITNSDNLVAGLVSIKGNDGADSLKGSDYSDLLDGGVGIDTLIGGKGNDIYIVDNANDTITENANEGTDTVKSTVTFSLGSNIENLSLKGTAAINGTGNGGNNLINGNSGNNTLSDDGGNDTLNGYDGDDSLNGGADNDSLSGGIGNDTLDGATGNDTLIGDDNNSALILDGVNDYVSVANSSSLNISQAITIEAWVKLADSAQNQKIIGKTPINPLNSGYLVGVDKGKLYPEFWDSQGNLKTFVMGAIPSNQWTHIAVTWQTGGSMIGYINGIEVGRIAASSNPLGTNNSNLIMGGAPWNPNDFKVNGAIDEVRIWNVARSATEISGNLNKTLGGKETGLVSYWNIDQVTGNTITDLTGKGHIGTVNEQGTNVITETAPIIGGNDSLNGGAGNDSLNGGAGNDSLNGGTGIDTLIGGRGDDIYIVDTTTDTITENANEGTDTIQSSVIFTLATQPNIENLSLTGTATTGTGNAGNNIITGNAVNNSLNGGDGNDSLYGNDGNDTLDGKGGNDNVYGGQGDDQVYGEWGDDWIEGNEGNDQLHGWYGKDTLIGGSGNDVLLGQYNDDSLNAGDGNDSLDGGEGKDTLTGGVGIDRFDYRSLTDSLLNNFDVITDFNANTGNDLFLVSTARAGSLFNAGSVATLDQSGIAAKLTSANFGANYAAQFIFGSDTFVAINDATAGFNANTDAIIKVTGFTGTLTVNNFTTVV